VIKAQDTIFGPEAIGEKSRGKKDLDAMEIDEIQRKEGKSLQYCQICTGKDFKNKSKMHNIVDCYNKPSNKDKCKNLGQDALELLLVQVDKENSMEFSFDFGTLLIHILCLLLFTKSHASPLGHSIPCVQQFPN